MGLDFDWNDLRFLIALHRGHSLVAAARSLAVDPTTVGRRVAALEKRAGARLVQRTPEGFVLTEHGLRLLSAAEGIEEAFWSFERAIAGGDSRLEGTLRVTTSEVFGPLFLLPFLGEFKGRFPGIQVELAMSTRVLDLVRREADVAIRLARPSGASLVSKYIGQHTVGLYASEAYLKRKGVPASSSELRDHDWLGYDESLSELQESQWLERTVGPVKYVFRTNSPRILLDACVAGYGLVVMAHFVERHHPTLRRVAPEETPPPRHLWIAYHRDLRKLGRVRAFVDFVVELCERERALLQGTVR